MRNPGDPDEFIRGDADNFALGGVFAGGLAVYRSFLKATSVDARSLEEPFGISLWNPTHDRRTPLAKKLFRQIPNKYWILSLGHLGQAYLWNLTLLTFPRRNDLQFLIQDFDIIEAANRETGRKKVLVGKRRDISGNGSNCRDSKPSQPNGLTLNTTDVQKPNPNWHSAALIKLCRGVF